MTYSVANPPALIASAVGGLARLWYYKSTDAIATVNTANYFTNGGSLGLKVGDIIFVIDTTNTLVHIVFVNATGNGLANTLIGNGGDNTLDGGLGTDQMQGAAGNDTYIVDNAGDVISEAVNKGHDVVQSSVAHTLFNNVEDLTLTGTKNINGVGNGLANVIAGNTGNNVLNGMAGNDTLTGGDGLDRFLFNTALNATTNVDTITDFVVADDAFQLDNAVFTAFPNPGGLSMGAFVVGTAATTASHRIVYDAASGDVFYDRDGSAAVHAQILFAHVTPGTALTNADFLIV